MRVSVCVSVCVSVVCVCVCVCVCVGGGEVEIRDSKVQKVTDRKHTGRGATRCINRQNHTDRTGETPTNMQAKPKQVRHKQTEADDNTRAQTTESVTLQHDDIMDCTSVASSTT